MVTIITGDRGFADYDKFCDFLAEIGTDITYVYIMGSQGANRLGARWAFENDIPIKEFPKTIRKFMIEQAEDIIYFKRKRSDPELLQLARKGGLEIYEYEF